MSVTFIFIFKNKSHWHAKIQPGKKKTFLPQVQKLQAQYSTEFSILYRKTNKQQH